MSAPSSLSWLLAATVPLACATTSSPTPTPTPPPAQAEAPEPPATVLSDDPVVARIAEVGRTHNEAHEHIRYLTEKIGPRLTSSHNLMRAEKWAVTQFSSWGLDARLEPWGDMAVGFDRGPWSGGQVAPTKVDYEFTTPAWSPGVAGPHRGRAVEYPKSVREVTANKGRLAGAWVVRPKWERGKGPDRKTLAKIDEALEAAGAAGVVRRDRDNKGELVHTGGDPKIKWSALPSLVQIRLRADQHDALTKQLKDGAEVELSFSVDNRFFRGPVVLNNVVADIKGSEKPDEYVVIGGHLDSWDGSAGAVDNGTGVATTMEAARLLMRAGARPKRTIRFMLWSGEEQGLLGSRGYVANNPELMDKISAVLVHDGGTNYLSGLRVTPEMRADMDQVFAPVMKLDPEKPFELYPADALRGGGSDHSSFIRAGVPGFFWMQSGKSNYRCHHHTQLDSLSAVIPEYQQHSAMVVAIAAYNLANLDHMLDRTNAKPLGDRTSGVDMNGMRVKSMQKDSLARKAGIRVGDQIIAVNGKEISSRYQLYRAVVGGEPKKKITVKRGKRKLDVLVDYANPEQEAERKRRLDERIKKYGKDAVTPDEAAMKKFDTMFGDRDKSCRPTTE